MSRSQGRDACPRCGQPKNTFSEVCVSCDRALGVNRRISSRGYRPTARCTGCKKPILVNGRCWRCAVGPDAVRTIVAWCERGAV